jgi:pyroglutamyl-peptidase
MARILLTGFEPFAGATNNSSWDAVERVAEAWSGEDELIIELLPVTFRGAGRAMRALIEHHDYPDLVIATGLANGRSAITPERVAINVEDARIPDNDGFQPTDREIGQEAAFFTGLPVKAIVERIRAAGIPSEVSNTAGTYVCNSLMYHLMDAVWGENMMAGFIHVPNSPELAAGTDEAFLEVEDIARGLTIAIGVSLEAFLDRAPARNV